MDINTNIIRSSEVKTIDLAFDDIFDFNLYCKPSHITPEEAAYNISESIREGTLGTEDNPLPEDYSPELYAAAWNSIIDNDARFHDPKPEPIAFTNEELHMLSDAVIGLIEKVSAARGILAGHHISNEADKYIEAARELNSKVCKAMRG